MRVRLWTTPVVVASVTASLRPGTSRYLSLTSARITRACVSASGWSADAVADEWAGTAATAPAASAARTSGSFRTRFLRRGCQEPNWADSDHLLLLSFHSVETEGTLGAVERGSIGGIPMRPLRWPYTRSETLDVTTKHTVSSCAAALLLDGDAG